MEPKNLVLCLGILVNFLLISLPLAVVDIELQEYFSRPIAWICYSSLTLFCLLEGWASFQVPYEQPNEVRKVSLPFLIGPLVLIVFWTSILDFVDVSQIHPTGIASGVLLVALGIALRLCSILKLRKYFVSQVALVSNHQLVTSGVYSIVRHPSEMGLLSICLGVAILLSSLKAVLIVLLILLPLSLYRISLEDKLLRSRFGRVYKTYESATPMLFPRLLSLCSGRALRWTR